MKKILFAVLFASLFGIAASASAQEASPAALAEEKEIIAQDLGVAEPRVLPDSRFYFLKNWARGLQTVFTFDQVKKAELKQKFLAERAIELEKLVQGKKTPDTIKKVADEYQKETERLKNEVEKIKDKAQDNPEVNKFLEKFANQGILHQRLLEKLANQVPPEAFEKIEEARQMHLQRFGEVMQKLEDKDRIVERLDKALEKQPDSQIKPLKDLQFLRNLEEKLPLQAKEAIKKLEEEKLRAINDRVEIMSPEQRQKVVDYLEEAGGDKEKKLEILENLKQSAETGNKPEFREKLEKTRTKVIEKIEQLPQKSNCPQWVAPIPGFCKDGRIVVEKDSQNCLLPAKCLIPEETRKETKTKIVCITLWDPVCGDNGKTYSNQCFARAAGVSIVSKGECPEKPEKPPVPNLPRLPNKEVFCQKDSDCACGKKRGTEECFFGNVEYVEPRRQCPDFCSGLSGTLVIKCIDNTCKQVAVGE